MIYFLEKIKGGDNDALSHHCHTLIYNMERQRMADKGLFQHDDVDISIKVRCHTQYSTVFKVPKKKISSVQPKTP